MGVVVTDASAMTNNNRNRSTSGSIGRSSGDTMRSILTGGSSAPKRPQRPVLPALTLTTSISTPHLRSTVLSSPASSSSGSSLASHTTVGAVRGSVKEAATSVSDQTCGGCEASSSQPTSRWSMDSVASRPTAVSFHPMGDTPATVPGTPQTPTSGRKRDRLMSFITRGRSGSLGKSLPPIPNSVNPGQDNTVPLPRPSVSREPSFVILSPRPSLSAPPAPSPYAPAMATPTATMLSTSSSDSSITSSASSLQTPVSLEMHRHALPGKHGDLYAPDSSAFMPEAYAASMAQGAGDSLLPPFEYDQDAYQHSTPPPSPPPEPTLPLPSPGTPTASFLVSPQQRSQSFFALPFMKGSKRRDKKLVITGVPLEDADDGRETDWKTTEKRRRYGNVVRWCEGFGEVRKIERKPDGTLHVFWRDWESADMVRPSSHHRSPRINENIIQVCRVHAQVYIKDVGRVSLAWQYIN